MVTRVQFPFNTRVLSQVAFISLLAGLSAACTSDRMGRSPLFTNATPQTQLGQPVPPQSIGGPTDTVAQGRTDTIQTAELPPPPGSSAAPANSTFTRQPMAPIEQPAMQQVAVAAPAETRSQTVTVADGETLYSLARRHNVSVRSIADANGLTMETRVRTGQRIVIPGTTTMAAAGAPTTLGAPPRDLGTITQTQAQGGARPSQTAAAGGRDYQVREGDTAYSVALAHGVSPKALAEANGVPSLDHLRVGQRLRLPDGSRPSRNPGATQVAATEPVRPGDGRPAGDQPSRPATGEQQVAALNPTERPVAPTTATDAVEATQVAARPTGAAAEPQATADEPSADGTSFRWPVRGRIISGFGSKPGGERNDGINLAVPEGTSVKAAEAGTVIYSGNEIAGYGNLILVRHAGGWVTAYAHNSELVVSRGDTVRRGQIVAKAGKTGSVNAPQVHFELRRGSDPVNPLDYLSGT